MHKVRKAIKSNEFNPLEGTVFVDKFVYGGNEDLKQGRSNDSNKKRVVIALKLDECRGVKRAFFKKIKNYSSPKLNKIFESHISKEAKVNTDK